MIIIDGSGGSTGYKKWRKRTLQSTYITKKMCGEELLVSLCQHDLVVYSIVVIMYSVCHCASLGYQHVLMTSLCLN